MIKGINIKTKEKHETKGKKPTMIIEETIVEEVMDLSLLDRGQSNRLVDRT